LPPRNVAGPLDERLADVLAIASGLVAPDLIAAACVGASQLLPALLRRPVEPGLDTAIGVMDQSWHWSPCSQRHLESIGGQLGPEMVSHGPADNLAAVRVEDDRQVQPALPGADVGDIAEPLLVGSRRDELPLHQILKLDLLVGHRCPTKSPRWTADQAGGAHQASDALAGDALLASTQVGMDTRRAVGAVAVLVNGPDLLR
jgi:hypothetical protein